MQAVMAAVAPYSATVLQTIKQIGVDDVVYYDMQTMPLERELLAAEVTKLAEYGLRMRIIECGPPIGRVVFGKSGRDREIEQFKRSLDHMGSLGVEILCYHFMPPVLADAMVVRTTNHAPARGGAPTTRFRAADVTDATVPHHEVPIPVEQVWDNLEYFLRRVLPAAEAAGVRLALHPDDPPLSPIAGLNRILSSVEAFDRLVDLSPSPMNGLTLCQGCFLEMGANLIAVAQRFRDRIQYIHFRDIAGVPTDFVETFPDDGPTDFVSVFRAFHEMDFRQPIRVDHVPRLAVEGGGGNDGYGFIGHIYATGYLKGLLDATFGKASVSRWQPVEPARRADQYVGRPTGHGR